MRNINPSGIDVSISFKSIYTRHPLEYYYNLFCTESMVESDRFQAKCGQNVALKGNFFGETKFLS